MLSDSLIADLAAQEVRAEWTRVFGALEVEAPAVIQHMTCFGRCRVGAFTYANHGFEMQNTDIGRFCSIAQHVILNPGHHPTGFLTTHPVGTSVDGSSARLEHSAVYRGFARTAARHPVSRKRTDRVSIGHDVWIGSHAIVLQDVTVGTGAVVGAGSVVNRDVPPFAIVMGVPARIVRYRFPRHLQDRILASRWWDYDLSALPERDYSDPKQMLDRMDAIKDTGDLPRFEPAVFRLGE